MVTFSNIILILTFSLQVRSINISGDSLVKEKELRSAMLLKEPRFFLKSKFHPEVLNGDIEALRSVYFSYGFLEPKITSNYEVDSAGLVDINIEIQEGNQIFVENITFTGNTIYNSDNLKYIIKTKLSLPFNPFTIEEDYINIINYYDRIGYHDTRVTSNVDIINGANINYQIDEGEKIYISEVIPTGAPSINTKCLKIAIGFQSGTILTNSKIVEARKNLYNLDLFSSIRVREEPNIYGRNVIFVLKQKEPITISLRFGYSELDRMKVVFIAKHNNLLSTLQRMMISGKLSYRELSAELGYRNPIIFERWVEYGLGFRVEQRREIGFKTRRFGGYITLVPKPFYIQYNAEYIRIFDVKIVDYISETAEWLRNISLGITLDKRDNPIRPHKGYAVSNHFEIAGIFPRATSNFIKNEFNIRTFHPLQSSTIGLRFDIGFEKPFKPTEEIPIHSRFFLGGTTTIRGYRERDIGPKDKEGNPLGGDIYILSSIESRIPIYKQLSGVIFIDTGTLEKSINDIEISPKVGFGLGFRLYTPIGPIRLDFARNLEGSGMVHFAIGETF